MPSQSGLLHVIIDALSLVVAHVALFEVDALPNLLRKLLPITSFHCAEAPIRAQQVSVSTSVLPNDGKTTVLLTILVGAATEVVILMLNMYRHRLLIDHF